MLAEGYAIQRSANPVTSPGSINFRNAFAPSDSKTPLQFLYEPANCRFFYTPQMINTPELVWKYAVGATWTDAAHFCVQGSRVQANTTRGLDPAFRAKNNGAEGNDGSTQTEGSEDNNEKPKSSAERGLKRGTTKGLWLPAIALATLLLF